MKGGKIHFNIQLEEFFGLPSKKKLVLFFMTVHFQQFFYIKIQRYESNMFFLTENQDDEIFLNFIVFSLFHK